VGSGITDYSITSKKQRFNYWIIDQSGGLSANFDNALRVTNLEPLYQCPKKLPVYIPTAERVLIRSPKASIHAWTSPVQPARVNNGILHSSALSRARIGLGRLMLPSPDTVQPNN
jgi:hypothetical protein